MEKEQRESRSGEKFTEELANLGIELNEHQKEQFDQYYELLVEWNKVMNLTGITEYKNVMKGIYTTSINENTLDEAPMAYKRLDDIIDVIGESVDVIDVMKPIYNFKASE